MPSGLLAGSEDHHRGFRGIVLLLIWLVVLPVALLLATGILMLIFWQAELNLLFGILVITFVACSAAGLVLSFVLLRREAKLSKLQTDFVSKVSHELRTPLTSIRMFAEMLQAGEGGDEERSRLCLGVLHKETIRLTKRIERLLDWGRMESGRRIYRRERDSVEAVVQDALAAFDAATVGREQEVQVEIDPDLPAVLVDREALADALLNLLSNAYKYTGDDKRIALRASADARAVRIAVADNGIGIPRREQRKIFQKFYRVDERLSRDVEGSGLGLAIVRHVVQAHGGRIDLESAPGKGSTFTIVLPRSKPDELGMAASSAAC
ncbi:MAG: two-component sensor histidine kinase [Deltaproteobacteria bacterium]|nr:two-component sensor histidine kinase [Deltaproteobacteria bacterium]